jgi:hypothetical protein
MALKLLSLIVQVSENANLRREVVLWCVFDRSSPATLDDSHVGLQHSVGSEQLSPDLLHSLAITEEDGVISVDDFVDIGITSLALLPCSSALCSD